MTPEEERLAKLEERVKNFKMVSSGSNQVQGGFPELKPKDSIGERLKHLEDLHDNFRITGGSRVSVQGSFKDGFAICATCPGDGGTGQSGPMPFGAPPVPPTMGACCLCDGSCEFVTSEQCTMDGGNFAGIGITCESFTCVPFGACCNASFCTNGVTETYCVDTTSGCYQGDCSTCDPNPCNIVGACCLGYTTSTSCVASYPCSCLFGHPERAWFEGESCGPPGPCAGACEFLQCTDAFTEAECTAHSGTFHIHLQCDGTPNGSISSCCYPSCFYGVESDCDGTNAVLCGSGAWTWDGYDSVCP